jgi:hypothetical protein
MTAALLPQENLFFLLSTLASRVNQTLPRFDVHESSGASALTWFKAVTCDQAMLSAVAYIELSPRS